MVQACAAYDQSDPNHTHCSEFYTKECKAFSILYSNIFYTCATANMYNWAEKKF